MVYLLNTHLLRDMCVYVDWIVVVKKRKYFKCLCIPRRVFLVLVIHFNDGADKDDDY